MWRRARGVSVTLRDLECGESDWGLMCAALPLASSKNTKTRKTAKRSEPARSLLFTDSKPLITKDSL